MLSSISAGYDYCQMVCRLHLLITPQAYSSVVMTTAGLGFRLYTHTLHNLLSFVLLLAFFLFWLRTLIIME